MSNVCHELLRHYWKLVAVAWALSNSLHDVITAADDRVQKLHRRILVATDAFDVVKTASQAVKEIDF